MSINPIELTDFIKDRYLNFLSTTFSIRDPEFNQIFQKELRDFKFLNGPFLQITPPFKKGNKIEELINEGVLNPLFQKFAFEAFPYLKNSPLYEHQEQAIRKVLNNRNIVISSGTGSGKTECFIIPIYNYLLNEYQKGTLKSGVRALLLYPMNALVNDQLRRLRELSNALNKICPEIRITFGRYTGETPESRKEAEQRYIEEHLDEPLCNLELLSREEMRDDPPHILITNYSMLEYLILRPKDCNFFDYNGGKTWKFIVLDESHTYHGASGIEMALLMRRLKDRICQNEKGKIRCIATSATLVGGKKDFGKVAKFAAELFDEVFNWDEDNPLEGDVISETRENIVSAEEMIEIPENLIIELHSMKNNGSSTDFQVTNVTKLLKKNGISEKILTECSKNSKDFCSMVYQLLKHERFINLLQTDLAGGTQNIEFCFNKFKLENNEVKKNYLLKLIELAVWARPQTEAAPLLPARYHLFVRAPEGVYISLGYQTRFFFNKIIKSPEGARTYEFRVCKRCGIPYLVGKIVENVLQHYEKEDRKPKFFLLLKTEIREFLIKTGAFENDCFLNFCTNCGEIRKEALTCTCDDDFKSKYNLIDINELGINLDEDGRIHKCVFCKYSSSKNAISEFKFQKESPAAVLASALYDYLIKIKREKRQKKILIFSDSRQDAAFFASYLDFNYSDQFYKSVIFHVIEANKEYSDYRLESLVRDIHSFMNNNNLFKKNMDDKQKIQFVWKIVLNEFFPVSIKKTLESGGLIDFIPTIPMNGLSEVLKNSAFNLTDEESNTLLRVILNFFREKRAYVLPEKAPPENEIYNKVQGLSSIRSDEPDKFSRIISFLPKKENNLTNYLKKIYQVLNKEKITTQKVKEVLGKIWQYVTQNVDTYGIYRKMNAKYKAGITFQIENKIWKIKSNDGTIPHFICDHCGKITTKNIRGICPTFRCNGTLENISNNQQFDRQVNYFRELSSKSLLSRMKVKEHTAQLKSNCAAKFQQKFINGDINILSCSTTFELGVDLGELELIFLKNVPPTPANYIQRSGRAGRRLNSIGFTLTFAPLKSHDMYFFRKPELMINGRIDVPSVDITNEKIIRRHLHSVVFSNFWKKYQEYFGQVKAFLTEDTSHKTGFQFFNQFLQERPSDLLNQFKRILPVNKQEEILGISEWDWIKYLIDKETGVLSQSVDDFNDQMASLQAYIQKNLKDYQNESLTSSQRNKINNNIKWANSRIRTLNSEDIISWLASANVIPKYGFPVDTVPLIILQDTKQTDRIKLERDLRIAISEFAPQSQVIANKHLWKSAAIRLVKDHSLPEGIYLECKDCGRFLVFEGRDHSDLPHECDLCHQSYLKPKIYITPKFGFSTAKYEREILAESKKPTRAFSSYPRLIEAQPNKKVSYSFPNMNFEIEFAPRGELAVICEGDHSMGFRYCEACGISERTKEKGKKKTEKTHNSPSNYPCNGMFRSGISLGHKFKTDVITIMINPINGQNIIPLNRQASEAFHLSFLFALLEGTSTALGVPRGDIEGCLQYTRQGNKVVLYDDVPGGAGQVKRLLEEDNFRKVLEQTWQRVDSCICDPEASCYGCLRNYKNERYHKKLKRKLVVDFLKPIMGKI